MNYWVRSRRPEPLPFDRCPKCGLVAAEFVPRIRMVGRAFPVSYCAGCDQHQSDGLHKTCRECGHVRYLPTGDPMTGIPMTRVDAWAYADRSGLDLFVRRDKITTLRVMLPWRTLLAAYRHRPGQRAKKAVAR